MGQKTSRDHDQTAGFALELLPCPFCGGEAHRGYNGPTKEQVAYAIGWGEDLDDGGSFIECMKCQASTALHYGRCENLLDAWNRRAPSSAEQSERASSRDDLPSPTNGGGGE